MYLVSLYKEFNIWRKVKKITKSFETELNDKGFRVDWIGRIYTVINLPEEVQSHNPQVQDGYILQNLRDYDQLFLKLGIADFIVPEFQKVAPGSYLLVLSPDRIYMRLWPFIKFLLKTGLLLLLMKICWNIGMAYSTEIAELWNIIINWIL